jgi:putative transposase
VKFAFIHAEKALYPVAALCRTLEVSRSGYHAWVRRPASRRTLEDRRLGQRIVEVFDRSRRTYGSPRITAELRASGQPVGGKRVARLMKDRRIAARRRRVFKSTTDSRHGGAIASNLVGRRFEASGPDRVWVGDVKAIHTRAGWTHLAVVMDLYSRRIVGWAMSEHNDTALASKALRRALERRRATPGLVHHTDRGAPYASGDYRSLLVAHGLVASMSRKGDCWDNAVAESFFSTLSVELLQRRRHATPEQAEVDVRDYIDNFYNLARRHSTIGYLSPVEYELRTRTETNAA